MADHIRAAACVLFVGCGGGAAISAPPPAPSPHDDVLEVTSVERRTSGEPLANYLGPQNQEQLHAIIAWVAKEDLNTLLARTQSERLEEVVDAVSDLAAARCSGNQSQVAFDRDSLTVLTVDAFRFARLHEAAHFELGHIKSCWGRHKFKQRTPERERDADCWAAWFLDRLGPVGERAIAAAAAFWYRQPEADRQGAYPYPPPRDRALYVLGKCRQAGLWPPKDEAW